MMNLWTDVGDDASSRCARLCMMEWKGDVDVEALRLIGIWLTSIVGGVDNRFARSKV